ncbi:MAG: flagellar motor switch protein FliG [Gemmatimonadetes bacterium]|nr:flagellar motor switch protein FliG [Gemmatimonadota bacterium]
MTSTQMVPVSTEQLTGRQKVAILCMALGAETASLITSRLPTDEVEGISFEIARMDRVSGEVVEAVMEEWLEMLRAAGSLAEGGVDYARQILERAFGPQRASYMMKRIQGQLADVAGLDRLRSADPQQLGAMLRGEHPQTIALILAHLDPVSTASILKEVPTGSGSEVVYRMAKMEKVAPEMLQMIENALGTDAYISFSEGMSSSGGPEAVAAVLNLLNSSLEKELLDSLNEKDPELCERIKALMFVFEDIVNLDDRSIQRLLREVESKQLALALKVASDELRGRILGAMTQRAVTALKEEMEFIGPARVRDVEAAQSAVVRQVRALEEAGEIVITTGADDLLVE